MAWEDKPVFTATFEDPDHDYVIEFTDDHDYVIEFTDASYLNIKQSSITLYGITKIKTFIHRSSVTPTVCLLIEAYINDKVVARDSVYNFTKDSKVVVIQEYKDNKPSHFYRIEKPSTQ